MYRLLCSCGNIILQKYVNNLKYIQSFSSVLPRQVFIATFNERQTHN